MADYDAKIVRCPFYLSRQEDKYRIKCEGPVKGSSTQLTFAGDKKWYMRDYCCNKFEKCRVYKMLELKYSSRKSEG